MQRTEDERFVARQEAARGAVNIDWEERQRRIIFGGALLVRRGKCNQLFTQPLHERTAAGIDALMLRVLSCRSPWLHGHDDDV